MSEHQTLAAFFGVKKLDFGSKKQRRLKRKTAHVVIDVQREFCDPEHEKQRGNKETVRISGVIAEDLAPKFRAAGMKTFLVYFSHNLTNPDANTDCGGFYKLQPEPGDHLVAKCTDSAFHSGDLLDRLKASGIKNIIVSGFNANACVKRTVLDALREEFQVCVLQDGVGNDNSNTYYTLSEVMDIMRDEGACVARSQTVLKALNGS